jgi:hypothetical protein
MMPHTPLNMTLDGLEAAVYGSVGSTATQLMHSAPWQVPAAALETEKIKIGVWKIISRRTNNFAVLQDQKILRLPGL